MQLFLEKTGGIYEESHKFRHFVIATSGLNSYQTIQGHGLLSRENYVNTLILTLGNDQTLVLGNQYMNDFETSLAELASDGHEVTEEQVLQLVCRLSKMYPGGIDHSTEMSLTMYGQDDLTQLSSQTDSLKSKWGALALFKH